METINFIYMLLSCVLFGLTLALAFTSKNEPITTRRIMLAMLTLFSLFIGFDIILSKPVWYFVIDIIGAIGAAIYLTLSGNPNK
jgi:hypothetical protein